MTEQNWFYESLYNDHGIGIKIDKVLLPEKDTGFQKISVFNNKTFGNVLTLDKVVQLTEFDEHFYHETITHTGMIVAGKVKHVLIIGGGDCGIAREVLKYKSVESVTIIDIDQAVTEAAKEFFPSLTKGVINNKRLTILHEDATKVHELMGDKKFELIIIDTTDETDTASPIFERKFIAKVKRQLTKEGTIMRIGGSVLFQKAELKKILSDIKANFDNSQIGSINFSGSATYYGGPFCLFVATLKSKLPTKAPKDFFSKKGIKNKYFNEQTYNKNIVTGTN